MNIRKKDIKKYIQKKGTNQDTASGSEKTVELQLLEYMGEEETEMYIRSAGLHPFGKNREVGTGYSDAKR